MLKWLLLSAGIVLFYLWFKSQKRIKTESQTPSKSKLGKAKAVVEPEAMVQCQYCKVHLPKSDSLANEDRFYCSQQHLDALDGQGWLGNAIWRVSPNQDSRPKDTKPDLIVVHHISLPPGGCLLYTSPSPRDGLLSRMPSSA